MGRRRGRSRRSRSRGGLAGDEDVLAAVVGERFAREAPVEGLDAEAGHVDEAEPLVLGRPPERDRVAALEREVDAVVADGVRERVREGLLLSGAVEPGGDRVVEREGGPGEAAARLQRRRHALEETSPVGPRRQVQERAPWDVDQRRGLLELEVAYVTQAEVEQVAARTARVLEHRRRRVDADHPAPDRLRNRDGHAARAYCELDDRPVRLPRELHEERDVVRRRLDPAVVDRREGFVTHARSIAAALSAMTGTVPDVSGEVTSGLTVLVKRQ